MWPRAFLLVVICAAAGGYYLWQTPQAVEQIKGRVTTAVADPQASKLYKWTDRNGQVSYGAKPPKGVRAQAMDETDTAISVVPATKVPVFPALNETPSDPRPMGQRAMDRAIDQSTQ